MSCSNIGHFEIPRKEGVEIVITLLFEPKTGETLSVDPLGYTVEIGDIDISNTAQLVDGNLLITATTSAGTFAVGTYDGFIHSNTLVDGDYWEATIKLHINDRVG